MIISNNKIRPIYPQAEINWQKIYSTLNVDGFYNFYFSGATGNDLAFKLKNNKIYSYEDHLLGGFNNNQIINFSGNVSSQTMDLYQDNYPLYLGLKRQGSGNILGFFIECENSNVDVNLLSILGKQPAYYYNSNIIYNSGEVIPIILSNSGEYPLTIYSGNIVNNNFFQISGTNNLQIPAKGFSNFYLINNGVFSNDVEIINLDLYTNIGVESLFINLSGNFIDNTLFYINLSPPVNVIFDGNSFVYTLNIANASGSNLNISLEYVSGFTGKYYKPIERSAFIKNQNVSGLISGSGFLYSISTGLVSGFNTILNTYEFGTGSGLMQTFRVADDQYIENFYNISGSGIGEAYLLTGIVGTGYGPIIYSGYITYLGGTLTGFSYGLISGIIPDKKISWLPKQDGSLQPGGLDENILNLICASQPENCAELRESLFSYKYATGIKSGVGFFDYDYTGRITGYYPDEDLTTITLRQDNVFVTGHFTEIFSVTGVALATGGKKTGIFLGDVLDFFEPGYWEVWKIWGGNLSGKGIVEWTGDQFDPILNTWSESGLSGYFVGKVSGVGLVDLCKLSFPEIVPSGIPFAVRFYDAEKGGTPPGFNKVYFYSVSGDVIAPPTPGFKYIEWPYENTDFVLNSGNISLHSLHPTGGRTRISRMGYTNEGSGKFDNVFQYPFFNGINEQKFLTGSGGNFILDISGNPIPQFKYKLDATGGKIPIYSGYKCQFLTGSNGTLIRKPLTCADNNGCVDGVCLNGICFDRLKDEFGNFVYDNDGNFVPDQKSYQCDPLRDELGNIIPQQLVDASGNLLYVLEPDMFTVATGFYGWKESIPVFTGRKFLDDFAYRITGISGNGILDNTCDYSYINFNINGSGEQAVNFEFQSKEPQNFLVFKLYKSGIEEPLLQNSGGLYNTEIEKVSLTSSINCDSGQYFGVLAFYPLSCLGCYIPFTYPCLQFSHTNYTGCENDGVLNGKILRNGYNGFDLKVRVTAYLIGDKFKYMSPSAKISGFIWDIDFAKDETEKAFSLPLYKNSANEADVFGKFHCTILNISGIASGLVGISDSESNFVIKDSSGNCESTISDIGPLPINYSGSYGPSTYLGNDFDFNPSIPSLSNWPYQCIVIDCG